MFLHALSRPSTTYARPLRGSRVRRARSLLVAGSVHFAGGVRSVMVDAGGARACILSRVIYAHCDRTVVLGSAHPGFVGGSSLAWPTIPFHRAPQGPAVAQWGWIPWAQTNNGAVLQGPRVGSCGSREHIRGPVVAQWVQGPLSMNELWRRVAGARVGSPGA